MTDKQRQSFEQGIDAIEQALDDVVEHGSDDELFIASYLQGHFALVVSRVLIHQQHCFDVLNATLCASLDEAFANQELEDADQQAVRQRWAALIEPYL
ncbi:YfcL family protein [Aestuariibacter halophilus]|uniref:YfcL family protein n=1 Tax=Fluctibacter halophilus TaxID=226011 RepID=A0ABS8G849_9ALTE|nr:YfcL family protein [Aestuariibacter halophilus]MCC2616754.1 YfcL family protein [Aestuariibacter halophilus]